MKEAFENPLVFRYWVRDGDILPSAVVLDLNLWTRPQEGEVGAPGTLRLVVQTQN